MQIIRAKNNNYFPFAINYALQHNKYSINYVHLQQNIDYEFQ